MTQSHNSFLKDSVERWCVKPIGHLSYIRISLCYFCFWWTTVSLVQASMHNVSYRVTASLR